MAINVTACATLFNFPTEEKYTALVNTWRGSDVNRLITKWGIPSDVYTMPNGNKMYTWLRTGGTVVTSNYNYFLNQTTSNQIQYWCKTTFTVDTSNIIISISTDGNSCVHY